jgi:preprotein translocase subunit SecA
MVFSMVEELATAIASDFFPNGKLKKTGGQAMLDQKELNDALRTTFLLNEQVTEKDINPFNDKGLKQLIAKLSDQAYQAKEKLLGVETMRQIEKMILLTTIDALWKDHLLAMDHLREGIGLQGYGQKDPLIEYKKQGFRFFSMMMNQITGDVVRKLFAVQMAPQEADLEMEEPEIEDVQYNLAADGSLVPATAAAAVPGVAARNAPSEPPAGARDARPGAGQPARNFDHLMRARNPRQMTLGRGPLGGGGNAVSVGGGGGAALSPVPSGGTAIAPGVDKVGRNDPCPCGSGKKYKKCHGA